MITLGAIPPVRRLVLAAALTLFAVWLGVHFRDLTAVQNGWIRFVLTLGFASLIIARPKRTPASGPLFRGGHDAVLAAIPGTAGVLAGLIFGVYQLEWIGVLLILWGSLCWALPAHHRHDVSVGLVLLYFAHPLPAILFGPLELAAQRFSVRGAEILLLGLDIRVWADGFVLHTGYSLYEVPDWCSGMRGATTVFLLAWGLAALHRLRVWEGAVLVLLALTQAMALNILRIATMVIFVPRVLDHSQADYLHHTAGLLTVTAVLLVFVEIRWWRARRAAVPPAGEGAAAEPTDWRHLRTVRILLLLGVLLAGILTLMVYRNRPSHRLAVLKDVALAAQDSERYDLALHIAHQVIARDPADTDWQLKTLRLLLTLQRFDEVESAAAGLKNLDQNQQHERDVLRAYALMALDRVDAAAALVADLPPALRGSNPRIAMILAVVGYRAGDAAEVARHLPVAARWSPNLERLRVMYPLLRQHREWEAISRTDSPVPYRQPEALFAAIEAHMNLDAVARVARLTLDALRDWPQDPRILEPLFYLAIKRPDSEWERRYAQQVRRVAAALDDPDALYAMYDRAFELGRPDLAWFLHKRLGSLDPDHPALDMAIVRHGERWLQYRRRALDLPTPATGVTLDLRPYAMLARQFGLWPRVQAAIPERESLATANPGPVRQAALARALERFTGRQESATLSRSMRYLHAHALELAGQGDAAREALHRLALDLPAERLNVQLALSEIGERAGRWQDVYEELREYARAPDPALTPLLRFTRAQLNLRLPIGAVDSAQLATRLYPRAALADSMLATVLMQLQAPEEALHLIDTPRPRHLRDLDILRAQALFATQRYQEAETFTQNAMLSRPPIHPNTPQRFALPPAEFVRLWHQIALPSRPSFERNAEVLGHNLQEATSPFLAALMDLWLDAYRHNPEPDAATRARWLAGGRDPAEQAILLNQWTLLLCYQGRYAAAAEIALMAARRRPHVGPLWRWALSLADMDPAVLAEARGHCPEDPELWLADVVRTAETAPERLAAVLAPALRMRDQRFPAETLTRAGEYLSRKDLHEPARALLHRAQDRATGLLPTHIQSLRAALHARDRQWAMESARQAIFTAVRPPPSLYRKFVDLKLADGEPDTDFDMVEALKNLRTAEPENLFWAELLGYVRFKRGGWEVLDALHQMNSALGGGVTNRLAFSIAAEAARLLDNFERSAEILREGLIHHPDDLPMRNNLAYVLALTPNGVAEAERLLPALLAESGDDPRILDTAAAVYTAAGRTGEAREIMARQLTHADLDPTLSFRVHLYEARLRAAAGEVADARDYLSDHMSRAHGVTDEDVITASRLIGRWRDQAAGAAPPAPTLTPEDEARFRTEWEDREADEPLPPALRE